MIRQRFQNGRGKNCARPCTNLDPNRRQSQIGQAMADAFQVVTR